MTVEQLANKLTFAELQEALYKAYKEHKDWHSTAVNNPYLTKASYFNLTVKLLSNYTSISKFKKENDGFLVGIVREFKQYFLYALELKDDFKGYKSKHPDLITSQPLLEEEVVIDYLKINKHGKYISIPG